MDDLTKRLRTTTLHDGEWESGLGLEAAARIREPEALVEEAREFALDVEETCSHPMTLVRDARALIARMGERDDRS